MAKMQEMTGMMQQYKQFRAAIADYVKNLIADVADELKHASRLRMELANTDGDIVHVYDLQDAMHDDYKQKTRVVGSILS